MPNLVGKTDSFSLVNRRQPYGNPDMALKRACEDFESLFVKQMLDSSRVGQTKEGLFGEESGSQILWDMHNTYLAESISHSHSLGVARLLYDQLKQSMGAAGAPAAGATTSTTGVPSNENR